MRKIIFLDIDGVLNTQETLRKSHNGIIGIDPYKVLLLDRIVQATGAEVVLSSSWRKGHFEELQKGLAVPLLDRTGNCCSGIRGVEIHNWLTENVKGFSSDGYRKPDDFRVAILDDDSDMLLWQKDHFFQTSFMGSGLNEIIADRVIRHLNGEKPESIPWREGRQNLLKMFEKFPNLALDVIDSAYLAGLEAKKEELQ